MSHIQYRQIRAPAQKLTTEEIVDYGIGGAVGVYKPVGKGEPGIHCLSVVCVLEITKHSKQKKGLTTLKGQL